jgi:subtilase family serine protease
VNYYYPDGLPRKSDSNWAVEVALDVEWAHAVAPQATIDLIIGLDNSLQHLYDAVQYVANNLPQEATLSMSWGDFETNYPTTGPYTIDAMHKLFSTTTSHGTTIFASSGDTGSLGCCAIQYPASDPLVVGVGGTTLTLNSNASYSSEQAWGGSTAGNSIVFPKPSWQQGQGDPLTRDSVDVSYVADPNTGVLVVQGGSQFEVGGTSAGSPQWAGLIALAAEAQGQGLGAINPHLYKLSTYHDVVHGFNSYYYATSGWDYPTGLGTPDAYKTIAALVPPVPVAANDTGTMQGATVTTTTALTVSQFTGLLSGTAMVIAKNSTTGTPLFSRNYNITAIQLSSRGLTYFGSFILNIPLTTRPLSSNIRVSEEAGNATATIALTRRLDMNGDGVVNILDLSYVASVYGITANSSTYNPNADVDANGTIDIVDLAYVAAYFNAPDYL